MVTSQPAAGGRSQRGRRRVAQAGQAIGVDHSKVFHGVYTLVNKYNQVVLQVRRFCQNAFFVHGGSRALCQWRSVAVAHRVDAGIRPMRRGEGVGQTSK